MDLWWGQYGVLWIWGNNIDRCSWTINIWHIIKQILTYDVRQHGIYGSLATVFKHFASIFSLIVELVDTLFPLVLVVDHHLLGGGGNGKLMLSILLKIIFHQCKYFSPQICFPISNSLSDIYFLSHIPFNLSFSPTCPCPPPNNGPPLDILDHSEILRSDFYTLINDCSVIFYVSAPIQGMWINKPCSLCL